MVGCCAVPTVFVGATPMSKSACPRPRGPSATRSALLAVTASVAVLASLACTSSNGSGDGDGTSRRVVGIRLESGSTMRGAQADLAFDPGLVVVSVQSVGPFLGETCEMNVGSNSLSLVCVKPEMETFDSPVTAWRVTVDHPASVAPEDLILSLACLASDPLGNTFPIACGLS